MADVLARRLAGTALSWAIQPILALVLLVVAVALFAAVGAILILVFAVAGALGLTSSTGGSGGSMTWIVLVVALIVSAVVLARPVRWFVRNLVRAERRLDEAVAGLGGPATFEPGAVPGPARPAPMTASELARLDARLAPPSESAAVQAVREEPER